MTKSKGKRIAQNELYELDRPYYGWTGQELTRLKHIPEGIKRCTTCHRYKECSNFISEYSDKEIKRCHFCQNRGFHNWRIDGHTPSRNGGIFNTQFLINTNNHLIKNFRDLDLSDLINLNETAILYNNINGRWIDGQETYTCGCGYVLTKNKLKKHKMHHKCFAFLTEKGIDIWDLLNILNKQRIEDIDDMEPYITCTTCKCKFINDDEHMKTDFGYTRLGNRYKCCVKCREKARQHRSKNNVKLPSDEKMNEIIFPINIIINLRENSKFHFF